MNVENNYMETDLGNVAPNPRGEFSEAEEYEYLDYVYYQGGSYLCLAELGTTIVGFAPEPGNTSQYWQAVALPGGLTKEYTDMHDRVVNLSEQVSADAEEVRTSKENIEGMETNVENLQTQAAQSAQSAEESKTQAAGCASAAEISRQAAAESEANVNAKVTGFDEHVSEKTASAEADIEAARIAANAAVVAQQEESVQAVKDQTAAYIANKQAEAEEVVENKAQEYGTNVDADIKTINSAGDVQVQAVNAAGTTQVGNVNSAGAVQITAVENAGVAQVSLVSAAGTEQKNAVKSEGATQVANVQEAAAEIISDREQIQQNKQDLTMLRAQACIFENESQILGLQVDYKNKTFTRLAGAVNLTAGEDFEKFKMYGGRKRCNVSDDGTIVAWYGDDDYAEDGSMGQVMVYQPKFYYLVCPVVYDPIETGIGYHLRKANYYVSEKPRAGFRLHPAFYDANGNEIDYFLTSAYEGSIFDVSADAFLMNDEQVMTVTTDKFCSIAGVKPASGLTQNLTRPNVEQMAKNRGDGWHGDLIKQVSAEQMLMIIEMGMMNSQTAIAQGIVSISDNSAYNCSSLTGSTASIGNGTGRATETINEKGGATTTETADEKTAVCWRGKENFWGNIWKFVYGINIWGNGSMGGGQPYICNDFNFAESRNSENYEAAGFTVTNANGYVSAMGYSTTCDWLFIASECLGNSSLPVGDYTYITVNMNGYRIARLGCRWTTGVNAGAFYWYLNNGVGDRSRDIGGRLVYIPTKDSAVYNAAIASWKEQMAA